MAGLLCAYLLTQAGVDTLLVEETRICGGVTSCTTAKITSQHGLIYHKLLQQKGIEKARMYLQANQEALHLYRELCNTIPCDFETKTNYVYSLQDSRAIDLELEAVHRLGFPANKKEDLPLPFRIAAKAQLVKSLLSLQVSAFPANKKEDLPLPFRIAGAIAFRQQAQFHPLQFAAHMAKKLQIYENTSVRRLDGTTVLTDQGRIHAENVIVATHFPFMNSHGSYFLKLYQQRSYVLALQGGANLGGMYVCAEKDGFSFRNAGEYLLLGGNSHRTGKKSTGWAPLEDLAKTCYPEAVPAAKWATQDCMSLDSIPYIGQYSKHTPGVYVATGFNKWGMSSSMAAAMILRDQILGKGNPYAPVFDPSRSMLTPQFAINAAQSALHLLLPTRPRCPHLGCALQWNKQEHSWDCPCHGSRFDNAGRKLNNPSQKDLKR